MTQHDERHNLMRLRYLAALDAFALSDQELKREDAEDGVDTAAEGERWRSAVRATAARIARESQPARSADYAPLSARQRQRPALDVIKALIRDVVAARPELAVAFREGKRQSEADWQSLYDDLVDMGALPPDEHAD
ncbi:hypothetical protein [Dokdonella sp.]|uniref:hypothetical protein n=1 Tax=Dokdonella sp. TaxID=2291710 RepID=UPI003782D744